MSSAEQRKPDKSDVTGEQSPDADQLRLNELHESTQKRFSPDEIPRRKRITADAGADVDLGETDQQLDMVGVQEAPEHTRLESFGGRGRTRSLNDTVDRGGSGVVTADRDDSYAVEPPVTYNAFAERASTAVMAEGRGVYSANGMSMTPDDGRGAVGAAQLVADRARRLQEADKDRAVETCEIGPGATGLATRDMLVAMQQHNPEVLADPRFKATIVSPDAAAIRESGIFNDFVGKVEVIEPDANQPFKLPAKPLFVMVKGLDTMPSYMMSKPDAGRPLEIQVTTFAQGDAPIIIPTVGPDGAIAQAITAREVRTIGVLGDAGIADYAGKFNIKVETWDPRPIEGDPASNEGRLTELRRTEETAARVAKEWPEKASHMHHYAPEVEKAVAEIVAQVDPDGMCMIEGRMRGEAGAFIKWPRLTLLERVVAHHVIERETVVRGVATADGQAAVFLPPRPRTAEGKFAYALVDRAAPDLQEPSREILQKAVSVPGDAAKDILSNAEMLLDDLASRQQPMAYAEANVEADGEKAAQIAQTAQTALRTIKQNYEDYVAADGQGRTLHATKADLPTELAELLRAHGHLKEALVYADIAIRLAPHVNARARVTRAKTLIQIGIESYLPQERALRFAGADRELTEACSISPRYEQIYHARAQLAMEQDDWATYAEAVTNIQRYAPQIADTRNEVPQVIDALTGEQKWIDQRGDNRPTELRVGERVLTASEIEAEAVVKAWTAHVEALERDSLDGAEGEANIRIERVRYDEERGTWTVDTEKNPWGIQAEKQARLEAAIPQIISTLHGYLAYVAPDRKEWQDRQVAKLIEIAEKNAERVAQNRLALASVVLKLSDEALAAAELYDAEHDLTPEGTDTPRRTYERVDNRGGINFADIYDKDNPDRWIGRFTLEWKELATHLLIAGATGTGKTTTERAVIYHLVKNNIGVWAVDLGDGPQFDDLPEYLAEAAPVTIIKYGNESSAAVTLGLLTPEPGYDPVKHMGLVETAFAMAFQAEEPFPQIVNAALAEVFKETGVLHKTLQKLYREHGWLDESAGEEGPRVAQTSTSISMEEFYETMIAVIESANYGEEVKRNVLGFVRTRLRPMLTGVLGNTLSSQNIIDVAALHDVKQHPVVVHDLTAITNPDAKTLIANLITIRQFEYLDTQYTPDTSGERLTHVTLFEEANRLWNAPTNPGDPKQQVVANHLNRLISQMRRFKMGIIITGQTPEELTHAALGNPGARIVHRLSSTDSRKAMLEPAGVTPEDDDSKDTGNLAEGRTFAFRSGRDDEPLLVQIPELEKPNVPAEQIERPVIPSRGSLRAPDGTQYTFVEVTGASEVIQLPQYASWLEFVHLMALARLSANPLPGVPNAMQEKYNEMDSRQRHLMVDAVVRRVVPMHAKGAHADALIEVTLRDASRMLEGVPLAGSNPGNALVSPELVTAVQVEKLTHNPRTATPVDPDTYVPAKGPHGTTGPKGAVVVRAGEQKAALEQRALDSSGATIRHPEVKKSTVKVILGKDNGKELESTQRITTNNDPDSSSRWLAASNATGIWEEGYPAAPWPLGLATVAGTLSSPPAKNEPEKEQTTSIPAPAVAQAGAITNIPVGQPTMDAAAAADLLAVLGPAEFGSFMGKLAALARGNQLA